MKILKGPDRFLIASSLLTNIGVDGLTHSTPHIVFELEGHEGKKLDTHFAAVRSKDGLYGIIFFIAYLYPQGGSTDDGFRILAKYDPVTRTGEYIQDERLHTRTLAWFMSITDIYG